MFATRLIIWRLIALSTPPLLTEIIVSALQHAEKLEAYLPTSQKCMLHINLLEPSYIRDHILRRLVFDVHRWRSLSVNPYIRNTPFDNFPIAFPIFLPLSCNYQ
jgi:hypothetical protein